MPDWKKIAEARGLRLNETELERAVKSLDSLHAIFEPLAATLDPQDDPAPLFAAQPLAREDR